MFFHEDGGHGWLRVKRSDFTSRGRGIIPAISHFSYMDAENVYLEEDSDMTAYLRFLGFYPNTHEVSITTETDRSMVVGGTLYIPLIHDGKRSPIRDKAHYDPSSF